MVKTTVKVEGMACSMCEAHVNEALRKAFKLKKVESLHKKCTTVIVSENELDAEQVKSVIEQAGYTVNGISSEPYEKKRFPFFG